MLRSGRVIGGLAQADLAQPKPSVVQSTPNDQFQIASAVTQSTGPSRQRLNAEQLKQPLQGHAISALALLQIPDVLTLVSTYAEIADQGSLALVCRSLRANFQPTPKIQKLQLADWLKVQEQALPLWAHFVSPGEALQALKTRSPRGLPPDAYLGVLLKRLPASAFKFQVGITVDSACALLNDNRLYCGERAVKQLVEALVQNPHLTDSDKAKLRKCVRNGETLPFRSLGDLSVEQLLARSVAVSGHERFVTSLTALAKGGFATASCDETVRFWDKLAEGTWQSTVVADYMYTDTRATVLADGRVAFCSLDGPIQMFTKIDENWNSVVLRGHTKFAKSIKILPNGRLVTTSMDCTARVWTQEKNGSWNSEVLGGRQQVFKDDVTVLTRDQLVMILGNRTAQVWTRQQGGRWNSFDLCYANAEGGMVPVEVDAITVLPGRRFMTYSAHEATPRVWTERGGRWTSSAPLSGHGASIKFATVLADGRPVTMSSDGTTRIWTATGGSWSSAEIWREHRSFQTYATVLPDGRLAAMALYDQLQVGTELENGSWSWSTLSQLNYAPLERPIVLASGELVTNALHEERTEQLRVWSV